MPPKRVTYVAALGLMIGAYGAPSGTGTAEAQCGARDISGPQGVTTGTDPDLPCIPEFVPGRSGTQGSSCKYPQNEYRDGKFGYGCYCHDSPDS